jgi:hypothetical protein
LPALCAKRAELSLNDRSLPDKHDQNIAEAVTLRRRQQRLIHFAVLKPAPELVTIHTPNNKI